MKIVANALPGAEMLTLIMQIFELLIWLDMDTPGGILKTRSELFGSYPCLYEQPLQLR